MGGSSSKAYVVAGLCFTVVVPTVLSMMFSSIDIRMGWAIVCLATGVGMVAVSIGGGWVRVGRESSWPDFQKWDELKTFRLYEAACLWNNEEPKLPLSRNAQRAFDQFKKEIERRVGTGEGPPTLSLSENIGLAGRKVGIKSDADEYNIHVDSMIGREWLQAYAEQEGARPPFLFKTSRA